MVPGGFAWFKVGLHGSRWVCMVHGGFSWFQVVFLGSRLVLHGSR